MYICIYIVASIFTNRSTIYIHSLATSLFKLTATAPSTGGRDMLRRMMKLLPGLLLKTKSWRRCGRGFPSLSESSWQSSTSVFFCSQFSGLTQWEIDSVTAFLPMQRSKNTQLLTYVSKMTYYLKRLKITHKDMSELTKLLSRETNLIRRHVRCKHNVL